jgi:hypothetical protein
MVEVAEVMEVIPLLTAFPVDREGEQDQAAVGQRLDLTQVLMDTLAVLMLQVHQIRDGVILELQQLAVVVMLDLEGVAQEPPVQHPMVTAQVAAQGVQERYIPSSMAWMV